MENSPHSDLEIYNKLEEIELNEHTKQDWYFAQLTWIVVKMCGNKDAKVQDFLLNFKRGEKRQMSQYEGMMHSISCWEVGTGKKATFKES